MMNENQMFEMMLNINIGCIANFHNHVDTALKEKVKEICEHQDLDIADKAHWNREYEVNFPEKLRETSFLLMFGHLEEMLHLLWRDKNPASVELDNGHGVAKFKSYIKYTLGSEFNNNADYLHIAEAQKIRNSFLHIAGRVSLARDSDALTNIIKKTDYYRIELDRIKIEYKGLSALQKSISTLTKTLLNKSLNLTGAKDAPPS